MNRQESLDLANKITQDIVSFFEVNPRIESNISDDAINISIGSSSINSLLIGRNSDTLRSIQMLISNILSNKNAEISRVYLDIADYKKQRADKISRKAEGWIEKVRSSKRPYRAHLNASDRHTVHQLAAAYDDIVTHSEGEGHDRVLIISLKETSEEG